MSASVVVKLWGAHACSVPVSAFCRNELFGTARLERGVFGPNASDAKVRRRKMRRPARCKHALPGFLPLSAFTVIELLVVMTVIIILAGLILSTAGYVQKKGNRSRAEAEIAAISAALESYKADNGIYPRGISISTPPSGSPLYAVAAIGTDDLDAKVNGDPAGKPYQDTSRYLYEQLSGDTDLDLAVNGGNKSYFAFKESQLALIKDASGKNVGLSHIKDPFGGSYGYSTAFQNESTKGYNPTFDLWSTTGKTAATDQAQWIKNW